MIHPQRRLPKSPLTLLLTWPPDRTEPVTSEATPKETPEPETPRRTATAQAGGLWQLVALLGAIAAFLMVGVLGDPRPPQPEESTPTAETSPEPPETPPDPSENQEILEQAQGQIDPGQASSYWRAIEQVRQIQAGEPLYDQAQGAIEGWSQDILELAEQRAEAGQLQFAIDAARLIPETSQVYETAQERIATWENQIP